LRDAHHGAPSPLDSMSVHTLLRLLILALLPK
jgi:hypothetical protein